MQSYRLLYKAVKRNHQKILFFNPFLQTLNLSIHCLGEACKQLILALVLDLLQTVMQNFKQCHIHFFSILQWQGSQVSSLEKIEANQDPGRSLPFSKHLSCSMCSMAIQSQLQLIKSCSFTLGASGLSGIGIE